MSCVIWVKWKVSVHLYGTNFDHLRELIFMKQFDKTEIFWCTPTDEQKLEWLNKRRQDGLFN